MNKESEIIKVRILNEKLLKEKVEWLKGLQDIDNMKLKIKNYEEITLIKPKNIEEMKNLITTNIELSKRTEILTQENLILKKNFDALDKIKEALIKDKLALIDQQAFMLNTIETYKEQKDLAFGKILELEKSIDVKDARYLEIVERCRAYQAELAEKVASSPKKKISPITSPLKEFQKILCSKLSNNSFRSSVSIENPN